MYYFLEMNTDNDGFIESIGNMKKRCEFCGHEEETENKRFDTHNCAIIDEICPKCHKQVSDNESYYRTHIFFKSNITWDNENHNKINLLIQRLNKKIPTLDRRATIEVIEFVFECENLYEINKYTDLIVDNFLQSFGLDNPITHSNITTRIYITQEKHELVGETIIMK